MKQRHIYGAVAACCVMSFTLVPSILAQEGTVLRHTGVPHDWSQSHIVFSRDALARHPELIYREPRILQQLIQRQQVANQGTRHDGDLFSIDRNHPRKPRLARDWSVTPLGGRLRTDIFPAKFSFDPNAAPDCNNDYVVFALGVAGANGGQANLIAFNNLYSGPDGTGGLCDPPNGPGLSVMFAYNVTTIPTGRILTSPVLSLDGTQIAFVESVPGATPSATFHVLTWTAGQGTITNAAAPTQMTSLTFSPTSNSTMSSPWVDYESDTAYMGAGNGEVYKITPVFNGTPALGGAPFPVALGNNLTPPVLDSARGLLMVGSVNGDLYSINITNGAVTSLAVGAASGTSSGIIAPPIVDVTNGTTFAVVGNNGTSAVLEQADTSSLLPLAIAPIGEGGSGGTIVHMYQPAFSNDYFNDPSTGVVSLCGTGVADTRPYQYVFGFTGRTMDVVPATGFPLQLSTSLTDRCTGWTEFFNPYAGASDPITATSVTSSVLTVTANNSDITVGQEVYIQGTAESFLNGRGVIVTSLIGSGPPYAGFTASLSVPDYTNPAETGAVSTGTDFFFFGLTQDCTFVGGTSTNGCVVAIGNNDGTTTTTTAQVTGGPSGIIVDNYSTAEQASSIYFTGLSVNTAFKFTQEGLQ